MWNGGVLNLFTQRNKSTAPSNTEASSAHTQADKQFAVLLCLVVLLSSVVTTWCLRFAWLGAFVYPFPIPGPIPNTNVI